MAATGVELASAYISLGVSTKGMQDEIRKALDGAGQHADAAGKDISQRVAKQIGSSNQIGSALEQSIRGTRGISDSTAREWADLASSAMAKHMQSAQNSQKLASSLTFLSKFGDQAGRDFAAKMGERLAIDLPAHTRSQRVGEAVGLVLGRGIGSGITLAKGAISTALTGVLGIAGVGAAGLGAVLFKGFDRLKSLDQANQQLIALGYNAKQIQSIMKEVNDVVEGTPIALQDAFGAVSTALGSGVKDGKDLVGYLTAIADAAGFAKEPFADMAQGFQKVAAQGKVTGDELTNQFRKLPLRTWIQETTGWTSDMFDKMQAKGQISLDILERSVEQHAGGMSKKVGDTIEGALQNLGTKVGKVGAEVLAPLFGMEPGKTSGLADFLNGLTTKLQTLDDWVKSHPSNIVNFFTQLGDGVVTAAQVLGNAAQILLKTVGVLKTVSDWTGIGSIIDLGFDPSKVADDLGKLTDQLGPLKTQMDAAGKSMGDAAQFLADLHGAAVDVNGTDIVLKDNTPEVLDHIDKTKFAIQHMPDGTVKLIPLTQEASDEMNAWRAKQGQQPVHVPIFPVGPNGQPILDIKDLLPSIYGGNIQPVRIPVDIFAIPNANMPGVQVGGVAPPGFPAPFIGSGGNGPGVAPTPGLPSSAPAGKGSGGFGAPSLFGPGAAPSGYAVQGTPRVPYGLPAGSNSGGYGGAGVQFPDWVNQIAAEFGIKPSTYSGHQESNRQEAGFAPNPDNQNRAIDWSGSPDNLQKFADYLATIPGDLEQVIWQNPTTGQRIGIAGGRDVSQTGYYAGDYGGHTDHVHTRQSLSIPLMPPKRYDGGGVLPPGYTVVMNATGQPELVLNPQQQQDVGAAIQGPPQNPGAVMPGLPGGAPQDPNAPQDPGAARTQGYIPAAAGSTAVAGTSAYAGFLNMGAEAINGLIDQAASMGGGAANAVAPGAGMAISMGAGVAKRAVSYGFQMAGIAGDALIEQLFPFGAPRWIGSSNPTAFMPQMPGQKAAVTTGEKAQAATVQRTGFDPNMSRTELPPQPFDPGGPVQPNQMPGAGGEPPSAAPPKPGSLPAPGQAAVQPSAAPGAGTPGGKPLAGLGGAAIGMPGMPGNPMGAPGAATPSGGTLGLGAPAAAAAPGINPLELLGLFDDGGWLEPGMAGVNMSKQPEPVFSGAQWKNMEQAAANHSSGGHDFSVTFNGPVGGDANDIARQIQDKQRLAVMQYAGRPFK